MNHFKRFSTFSLLILIVVGLFFSCKNSDKEIVAKHYMQSVVIETNKKANLPAQIDENTFADKVVFDYDSNTVIYSFKVSTSEYSVSDWKEHLMLVEQDQIITAKELQGNDKYYKTLGVIIESVYMDLEDGNEIYRFKIKPEQYIK